MSKAPRDAAQRIRLRARIAATKAACHICGKSIDYTLKYPDRQAFTIDHVIPLHRGGTDTIDNVKAAHAACNSTKRARLVAPIVKRSGSLG